MSPPIPIPITLGCPTTMGHHPDRRTPTSGCWWGPPWSREGPVRQGGSIGATSGPGDATTSPSPVGCWGVPPRRGRGVERGPPGCMGPPSHSPPPPKAPPEMTSMSLGLSLVAHGSQLLVGPILHRGGPWGEGVAKGWWGGGHNSGVGGALGRWGHHPHRGGPVRSPALS